MARLVTEKKKEENGRNEVNQVQTKKKIAKKRKENLKSKERELWSAPEKIAGRDKRGRGGGR